MELCELYSLFSTVSDRWSTCDEPEIHFSHPAVDWAYPIEKFGCGSEEALFKNWNNLLKLSAHVSAINFLGFNSVYKYWTGSASVNYCQQQQQCKTLIENCVASRGFGVGARLGSGSISVSFECGELSQPPPPSLGNPCYQKKNWVYFSFYNLRSSPKNHHFGW